MPKPGIQRARLVAIATRFGSIGLTFLLTLVVARLLAVEVAGSFFSLFAIVALLATVGRIGMDQMVLKVIGGDSVDPRRDTLRGLGLVAGTSLVVVGVALLLATSGILDLLAIDRGILAIGFSAIVPQALAVVSGAVLRALGLLAAGIFAELGSIPFFTIATVLTVALSGGLTLQGVVLAFAAASWLTALWSVPAAIVRLRSRHEPSTESSTMGPFLRQRIRPLLAMMASSLFTYLAVWLPVYVLTATGSLAQVALYSVAARFANILLLVPSVQVSYLAPEFARLFQQGDLRAISSIARRSALQAVAVVLVPLIIIVLFPTRVLTLAAGPGYAAAAPALIALSVGAMVVILAGQVTPIMLVSNLEVISFWLNLAQVVLWLSLGVVASILFGVTGAAIVSATLAVAYAVAGAIALDRARGITTYPGRPLGP